MRTFKFFKNGYKETRTSKFEQSTCVVVKNSYFFDHGGCHVEWQKFVDCRFENKEDAINYYRQNLKDSDTKFEWDYTGKTGKISGVKYADVKEYKELYYKGLSMSDFLNGIGSKYDLC